MVAHLLLWYENDFKDYSGEYSGYFSVDIRVDEHLCIHLWNEFYARDGQRLLGDYLEEAGIKSLYWY